MPQHQLVVAPGGERPVAHHVHIITCSSDNARKENGRRTVARKARLACGTAIVNHCIMVVSELGKRRAHGETERARARYTSNTPTARSKSKGSASSSDISAPRGSVAFQGNASKCDVYKSASTLRV